MHKYVHNLLWGIEWQIGWYVKKMYGSIKKNRVDLCSVSFIHEDSKWHEICHTVADDWQFFRERFNLLPVG